MGRIDKCFTRIVGQPVWSRYYYWLACLTYW